MKVACPQCSQHIELTPDVLAARQGQTQFACPSCQGLIPVPALISQPQRPAPNRPQSQTSANVRQAHRGLNRNMLVLGVTTLIVLGGIGIFLASRNGGNIFNTFNNITNQIIHNSYFTQLIASGVTTEEDLKSIADIRPYGDDFIGISKEPLAWELAQDLVKRTGAEILAVQNGAASFQSPLLQWLTTSLSSHLSGSVWVTETSQPRILEGSKVLLVTDIDIPRKVLIRWRTERADGEVSLGLLTPAQLTPRDGTNSAKAILDRKDQIAELERRLAASPGGFDWGIHNELRHLYGGIDEQKQFFHCNAIFEHKVCDGYILDCIGARVGDKNRHRVASTLHAASSLLEWPEKYPEYFFLSAACWTRTAELLGPDTAIGKELLRNVLALDERGMQGYRAKANALLSGFQREPEK